MVNEQKVFVRLVSSDYLLLLRERLRDRDRDRDFDLLRGDRLRLERRGEFGLCERNFFLSCTPGLVLRVDVAITDSSVSQKSDLSITASATWTTENTNQAEDNQRNLKT